MDYVQDISVFLVSHFRLQYLETPVRRRINSTILRFHDFARNYAAQIGDTTFDQRLALGVARSLCTSTRFVLDRELARSMFLRARYVLERFSELLKPGDVVIMRNAVWTDQQIVLGGKGTSEAPITTESSMRGVTSATRTSRVG